MLRDFRSYPTLDLKFEGEIVAFCGENGAGKTNLLEAISFLAPGRGLRGAAIAEVGRRLPGEPQGRPWAVSVLVTGPDGEVRLGAGTDSPAAVRRLVRIDG